MFGGSYEDFLQDHGIQPHAADSFRALPPELQDLVVSAGSLADARDPTAVLMSRIKKARLGQLKAVEARPGDWACEGCGELNFASRTECRRCGMGSGGDSMRSARIGGRAPAPARGAVAPTRFSAVERPAIGASPVGIGARKRLGEPMFPSAATRFQSNVNSFAHHPPLAKVQRINDQRGAAGDDLADRFLAINQPQPHAVEAFWALPPDGRQLIIDAGTLADARDPTAVLLSRIKKFHQGTLQPLKTKPGDWQCTGCFDVNFARNDVCRTCQRPAASQQEIDDPLLDELESDPLAEDEVEDFLELNAISPEASQTFRELAPSMQRLVIDVGSLADARDPTAVLISRMKKARHGELRVAEMRPGDWKCPACGDHNFARNTECRRCGHVHIACD